MPDSDSPTWKTFIDENPTFPAAYHKAWQLLPELFLEIEPQEDGQPGMLILQLMIASISDFDDIMLLSSHNGHFGALRLLRSAFERTVTLKYIAQNPTQADAFVEFDALDWHRILASIETKIGARMPEQSRANLDRNAKKARKRFKQEPCEKCGLRKQTNWTPLSVRDLAKQVDMDYMFFDAFELPSKFIHPTYWGTHQAIKDPPMYNTLKRAHELLLEIILAHQRYFRAEKPISDYVQGVVRDFFAIWKFAETDFGLPPGHVTQVSI